jgi:hypothetical protein
LEGAFFTVTRWDPVTQEARTVMTVLAEQVIMAEIDKDGAMTEYVAGAGAMGKN